MVTKSGGIACDLQKDIDDGIFPPGTTLPSIPELMDRYQVARDTVRDGIAQLVHSGLVTTRRGVGTIVRDTAPVDLTANQAPQSWEQRTGGGRVVVTEASWENADMDVSRTLAIPLESELVRRVRHFYQGEGIAQISEQWIPGEVARAIQENGGGDLSDHQNRPDTSKNLFLLMAEAGFAPTSVTEHVSTRMPRPEETDQMEIPPGTPVLVTNRIVIDEDNTPVETTTAVGVGDRMSATFTVPLNC